MMKIQKKTLETDNLIVSCDEDYLVISLKGKPEKGSAKKITIPQSYEKELLELIKQTSPTYKPPVPLAPIDLATSPTPQFTQIPKDGNTAPQESVKENSDASAKQIGPIGEPEELNFTDLSDIRVNVIKSQPYNKVIK